MRLWVLTVVLLAACLAKAVEVDTTEAQQTTEKGQQTQQPQQSQQSQQTKQQQQARQAQKTKRSQQKQEQQIQESPKIKQPHQTHETQQPQQPAGKQPQTQQPTGRQTQTQQPTGRQPQTQQPTGRQTQTQQPTGRQSQTQQPTGRQPQTQQPTGRQPQTQQPTGKQPQTQQPTGRQPQTQQRRILFLYPLALRSHCNFFAGIVKALVDAGHHVTVVAPHRPSDEVRMVQLKEDMTAAIKDPFRASTLQATIDAITAAPGLCSDILAMSEVQELLKEEFDLAILSLTFCDCFLSLVHQLKVPYIWATPTVMTGPITTYSGSPQFPSFMGSKITYMRHPLSFHERVIATLFETSLKVAHSLLSLTSMEQECRRRGLCPPDMPNLRDMASNSSLVILNSVRPLEFPARPAVPAEVYAGGIHCHPAQPLPQELEAWVQGAGEAGFIFFSLGSVLKASSMPEKARVALLETFGNLNQRILWKWDQDTMPDLPPNVRLAKWLPQQDILGHPRLRLFITHGGLMSTTEASCHGVPVLGLPVFADQHANMQEAQAEGWGRHLVWEELTGEAVRDAILGMMTDDVRARARHRAVMMRDLPMTPAETVVFWVEYVIRHGGAPHLRCPAADLPWYKLYNVDVWATVAVVVLLVTYCSLRLTAALCFCLCRLCRPRPRKTKDD